LCGLGIIFRGFIRLLNFVIKGRERKDEKFSVKSSGSLLCTDMRMRQQLSRYQDTPLRQHKPRTLNFPFFFFCHSPKGVGFQENVGFLL
ncbi:MAG: hypothetical protein ACK55Z_33310, partial [bacterium]